MADSLTKPAKDVQPGLQGIKTIIAIASGKGGVGKSTVASNLVIALREGGAKVGLLDADIYGPSQPGMLGSRGVEPRIGDGVLYPTNKYGISFVSMGLLSGDDTPVIWRAPMAMKMIHQFLSGVMWGELDYLLIDLPPGTGDVQLTLAQQAHLTGTIIVTTPQEVALGVARKGLRMFEQVKVPILGVIENMSGFVCKHCGEETAIFDSGGGERLSLETGVPFLGKLPLDPEIMMSGDSGEPLLTKTADSPAAQAFLHIADRLKESLKHVDENRGEDDASKYEIGSDGKLHITWSDGKVAVYEPHFLRKLCPCAACVDEDTGKRTLDLDKVPLDISFKEINPSGRYGLAIGFSDGHNTGIYKFELLRNIFDKSSASKEGESQGGSFSV